MRLGWSALAGLMVASAAALWWVPREEEPALEVVQARAVAAPAEPVAVAAAPPPAPPPPLPEPSPALDPAPVALPEVLDFVPDLGPASGEQGDGTPEAPAADDRGDAPAAEVERSGRWVERLLALYEKVRE